MKLVKLEDFFLENKRVALGFSGGVDSSFLLWAAMEGSGQLSALRCTPFPPQVSRPGGAAVRLGLTFQPAPKAWPAFQKIKWRYLPVI